MDVREATVGASVIATDAYGDKHAATIISPVRQSRGRGEKWLLCDVMFADGHSDPWPLDSLRREP